MLATVVNLVAEVMPIPGINGKATAKKQIALWTSWALLFTAYQ